MENQKRKDRNVTVSVKKTKAAGQVAEGEEGEIYCGGGNMNYTTLNIYINIKDNLFTALYISN